MKLLEPSFRKTYVPIRILKMPRRTRNSPHHLHLIRPEAPLLAKIRQYRLVAAEFKAHLDKHPEDWGFFQSSFNQEINGIFRDIMNYEKAKVRKGDHEGVARFKKFFKEKLEKYFSYGEAIRWSQKKPLGYSGDYKMIESIYENNPQTTGFDRLFDNYMQMSAISVGVRNRKEDFKRMLLHQINQSEKKPIRILSLACGSSREWFEILRKGSDDLSHVTVDCLDSDEEALKFSKERLGSPNNFNFIKKNVARLALDKKITQTFPQLYDFIYSTGLFDYLDLRISLKLVCNLKVLLKPGGLLAISDVQDKYSNPSLPFMELVGLWELLYRDRSEFKKLFLDAGFYPEKISYQFEQQGIMQYVIAEKE